jgi:Tfp pilus assembly protein PilF
LALLTFHEWNFPEAEREYKLAVTLGPNYATAHDWYGDGFLVLMGRFEETNQEMKQALALDPVSRIIATDWGQVRERFANHRLVTGGRTAEGCDSSQVTDLPLVGQPIG